MEITSNEAKYMRAIKNSDYQDEEDGTGWVWSWDPAYAFGKSAGGIAASLCKKGLAEDDGLPGEESSIRLTEKGAAELKKLDTRKTALDLEHACLIEKLEMG